MYMINIIQFRELIVKPSLNDLVLYSKDAEELLVFTCAVESGGGTYIKQVNGVALGIYQMEPATHTDIWINFINFHPSICMKLSLNFAVHTQSEDRLIYDLRYATAMCRLHYYRNKEKLPSHQDENAIWEYYKKFYNTPLGKAKKEEAISKYHAFRNS